MNLFAPNNRSLSLFSEEPTLAQVAQEKPDSIAWYVNSYNGRNNILKAAAKILLEIATNEKLAG